MTPLDHALRIALEHVEDAVVIIRGADERRIVYVNAAFTRASLYTSDEAVGCGLDELQRPRAVGVDPAVTAVRRKDGTEYVVRKHRSPVEGEGEGSGAVAIEVQRADDARARMIAENTTDMISTIDAEGTCTYISPSCRDVIGYEPSEVIGVRNLGLAHPDDQESTRSDLARAIVRGELTRQWSTRRVRHKNGSYVWLESSSSVIRDAQGRIVEIQSSGRDVTARVVAEEALARSEANLRTLLDQLPEAVALHRKGTVVYANVKLAQMLDYASPAELLGMSVLDFVPTSDRAEVGDLLRNANRVPTRSNERRALCADGQSIDVHVSALPILFEGELAVLVAIHDLTERKKLEAELAVADRLASLGRLAAAVGHEINNPLAYVLASIERMRSHLPEIARKSPPGLLASFEESAAMAQEGAERVRDMVRDLRVLSSAGASPSAPVDVHRALDLAVATADHEIKPRARLTKDYGDVGMALGDERKLVQVFVNLLVNAAQATPAGDVAQNEIRITTRRNGDAVTIEIRDTGCGLPEAEVSRIFEPFFTTKADGSGTGLGLTISHQIVTALGGTLVAEPSPPRGTLFRVSLRASTEVAPSEPEIEAVTAETLPRQRILVIDDEPQILRAITLLLSTHDVAVANGGREARELLETAAPFDVILCDLQMSDGTGADVYDHVRARFPTLERRMIFMTGGAFTERARAFLASCPQPFVEKPFSASRLAALIAEVIR